MLIEEPVLKIAPVQVYPDIVSLMPPMTDHLIQARENAIVTGEAAHVVTLGDVQHPLAVITFGGMGTIALEHLDLQAVALHLSTDHRGRHGPPWRRNADESGTTPPTGMVIGRLEQEH